MNLIDPKCKFDGTPNEPCYGEVSQFHLVFASGEDGKPLPTENAPSVYVCKGHIPDGGYFPKTVYKCCRSHRTDEPCYGEVRLTTGMNWPLCRGHGQNGVDGEYVPQKT